MIALNIGSGQRPFKPPFYNYDIQEKWRKPTEDAGCWWSDLSKPEAGLFIGGSVDIVVLHHVLEHLGCGEGDGLVTDCFDMLKKGGSLIVCVPDVKALARGWMVGRITDQVYMTNLYGAYMGDEADRHKWGYTQYTLMKYLQQWDWAVKPFDFRQIEGASIAQDWYITGMECVK